MVQFNRKENTMKKSLAVISIIACMFGVCACGSDTVVVEEPICTAADAENIGIQTVDNMAAIVANGLIDQYEAEAVSYAGLQGWSSAIDDIGTYTGVKEVTSDIGTEKVVIDVTAGGSKHDAVVEIILNQEGCTSITTSVQYTFGEMMSKAGLNTLIGMCTVFAVLILICLIISCFYLIPKIQAAFSKEKRAAAKDIKAEAVDNTIAQIIEKEEASDDWELIAVIAAAIAASEGSASTDGFVVRSIRKRA